NDASMPPARVLINEWMAANTAALLDPTYGSYSDWFELFNSDSGPVDLAGWMLDSPGTSGRFVIPAGVTVGRRGFIRIWADNKPGFTNGALHVNFKLNKDGDGISLYDPRGTLVDTVVFG